MLSNFSLSIALAATSAHALKVGVVSDLHTNMAYSATASESDNCVASNSSVLVPNDESAPIARINCDPSSTLVDYMLQRFNAAFGAVDVLLVTGDHIAHDIAPDLGEATSDDWAKVQANLEATAELLQKNFPSTLVLMNIGNNDGYHSQGPKESQKSFYYGFLHDLFFTQFPGNASIVDYVKETFMSAGNYRADVTDTVSVLSFNNNYMDDDNDSSVEKNEASEQLDWLEAQLATSASSGRKFILAGHQYAGTRYHASQMWKEDIAERYFQILRDNHEAVIIEVMGHDHFGDLRYHSSDNVPGMKDSDVKFDFRNMLVAPGVTPNKGNNPGVAMFEVSSDGVPSNLQFEFIDLVPQLGKSSVSYSDLEFLSLDMSEYGLTSLTASALSDFRNALENDKDMTLEYLTRKMGFNAKSSAETEMAYAIYEDKDLITTGKQKTGEFICQMHKSLSPNEYDACCASANLADSELPSELEVFLQ